MTELKADLKEELIKIRRELHRYPELGLNEIFTSKFIVKKLKEMNLEVFDDIWETGVVGILKGDLPGKTILFRCDMDGLKIQEETNCDYKSKNENMHACGHDIHITWVLGAAKLLSDMKHKIKGNIKFLFQPAEENPGGAREMIRHGVLNNPKVDYCIGAHVYPDFRVGEIGYREKEITAYPDFYNLKIFGKGGHGSMPHKCNNPIPVGVNIVSMFQNLISLKINPFETAVISTCIFRSGTSRGAIPDTLEIEGTARSYKKETREMIEREMKKIVENICRINDMKYEFQYNSACIPIYNNPLLINNIISNLKEQNFKYMFEPFLGGEDFAFFSREVPSAFFFIGSSNEDLETNYPLHHPKFNVDENVIFVGVKLYYDTALYLLA
ncbi:MAG: M20 metallopeptidase family protein [Cetobacterium sp.]